MANIAIIGVDAQFAQHQNVDSVERAFYLGNSQATAKACLGADFRQICQETLTRLAQVNQHCLADIIPVVVCERDPKLSKGLWYASLAQALVELPKLLLVHPMVALIGWHVSSVSDDSPVQPAVATISFDQDFTAYPSNTGYASLLLTSADFACQQALYIYAWLTGFSSHADIAQACDMALAQAKVSAKQVELLEVSALANLELAQQEITGLVACYNDVQQLQTALSSVRSVVGEAKHFSQLAGLLRLVLAIQQGYIPGLNDWQAPHSKDLSLWQNSPFYFPVSSQAWFPRTASAPYIGAYSCLTDRHYCHIVIQQASTKDNASFTAPRKNGFLANSELRLVIMTAKQETELLTELDQLMMTSSQMNIRTLSKSYYQRFQQKINNQQADESYRLVLMANSMEELLQQATLAKQGVSTAFATKKVWKTPNGSFFTPQPLGPEAKLAFLYPGVGAPYLGVGSDLLHLFPASYQAMTALLTDLGQCLHDKQLNPRNLARLSFQQGQAAELALKSTIVDIAEAGVSFACLFTYILTDVLGLKADLAAGYSMGEVSMYAALGCWQDPSVMSERLANSSSFTQQLCGPLAVLDNVWPQRQQMQSPLWQSYTIKAPRQEVEAICQRQEQVYCTIINTDNSVVVAGYPPACQQVFQQLGVKAMPLHIDNIMHCSPVEQEYQAMVELYSVTVAERIATKLYSSSCYLPIPQLSHAIAHSIAKGFCQPVDFPRLIQTLEQQGAKVFIEVGPGRALTTWVDKVLSKSSQQVEHLSVPINVKGCSDEQAYLKAVAQFVSHGIELELNDIFTGSLLVTKVA